MDEARPITVTETAVEAGSGNVLAELGLAAADEHIVKAELVTRIDAIVRQRGISQVEAARLLGLSQPDVSRLLRGISGSIRWSACCGF